MDTKVSGFKMVVLPIYIHVISKACDKKGQGKMRKKHNVF